MTTKKTAIMADKEATAIAQMAGEQTQATPEAGQPEAAKQYIYLGPNHPRGLLAYSTIFKGGVPAGVTEILEKCPSAKALLVETDRAGAVMQALRKADSAYAALHKKADNEMHTKGV